MIRLKGTIEYRDGRLEAFETGTSGLMAYERYAIRNNLPIGAAAPMMTVAHVLAWHAVAADGIGFDTWADTVAGVEMETEEAIPPILSVASGE